VTTLPAEAEVAALPPELTARVVLVADRVPAEAVAQAPHNAKTKVAKSVANRDILLVLKRAFWRRTKEAAQTNARTITMETYHLAKLEVILL
jgi:ABC-type arginine transport system ATPase subunit